MGSIRNSGRGPFRTAAALLAAGAFLVGCGDDDTSKSASGNSTDRAFARSMIPHHEGAVEMAELAQERAQHRELRSLAKDIVASQTAEIRTLRRVEGDLKGRGVHHGDLGLDEHMMGMDHDIHGLGSAREFDRAFIDMMVPHHQGAIRMSEIELRRGDDSQLRRLARDIIAAQKREIRQMQGWRKSWYGGGGGRSMPGHGGSSGHMMDG